MASDVVADLVKSTAFLRREFLGRDRFNNRENTIYIYDTDVIKANCAPWTVGPGRDQGGNGYGEPITFVEPEEKRIRVDETLRRKRAEAVADILARHAVTLSRNLPIYQFQPQFEETTEVYGFVRRDAERVSRIDEQSRMDRDRRSIIQASALIAAKRSGVNGDDDISLEVDYLMRLLDGTAFSTPSRSARKVKEWDRFVDLNVKRGGIFPINHAARHFDRQGDDNLSHALGGFEVEEFATEEARFFHSLQSFWAESLQGHEPLKNKRARLAKDAEALSYLAVLNRRLYDIGWRAVFVTGATNIVDASYAELPKSITRMAPEIFSEFGHRFVRHLWAYTSDALIEPYNKGKFVNWLDGLLAKWAESSEFREQDLTKLLTRRTFPHVSIKDCREALEMWDEMTQTMVSQDKFIWLGEKTQDLQNKLVKRIELARGEHLEWGRLVELLNEDNDQNNDETFLAFSNIGAEALISAQQASRHPPDLDFESLTNTKKIFAKLTSGQGYETRSEFESDFVAIKSDCYDPKIDNRQYCHLRYLALGAAFASSSRWSVALSQAQRAIRIIERSIQRRIMPIPKKDSLNSYMSGREAYFLAAVSLRMIAKSPRDFDGSTSYLKKAEEALILDRKEGTAKKFDNVRFANERLAQSLSRYYFERMSDEADLQDEFFLKIVSRLDSVLKPLGSFHPSHKLKSRRAATLAHAALNCIQARVIYEYRIDHGAAEMKNFPVDDGVLVYAISLIEALAADDPAQNARLFRTKLMKCYLIVGNMILKTTDRVTIGEVDKAFDSWKKSVVTEYDDWRYRNLYRFACELIADR